MTLAVKVELNPYTINQSILRVVKTQDCMRCLNTGILRLTLIQTGKKNMAALL